MPPTSDRRGLAGAVVIGVGVLLVLGSPLVFFLVLSIDRVHGDGMGALGTGLYAAIGSVVVGLVLVVAGAVGLRRSGRSAEPTAGPGGPAEH